MNNIKDRLLDVIRLVPGFPSPDVMFRDITPLLRDARLFKDVIQHMGHLAVIQGTDVIAGIESRGFIFAAAVAAEISCPLVLMRKPGKLPNAHNMIEYDLEYGKNALCLQLNDVQHGQHVTIIDDVLATGGTAKAAGDLVTLAGGEPSYLFLMELRGLLKHKLSPVATLISY